MSADVLRIVIGIAVVAHGVGHVLFMPPLNGVLRLDSNGHSWLLGGILSDGGTAILASVLASLAGVAFVATGVGIVLQTGWWRQLAILASVVSIVLVAAMWNGVPTSSAAFALAFDVVVLLALLVAHWPAPESIGS
jgi:hypothetical protein